MFEIVVLFLFAVNLATLLAFWHDKARAIAGGRRVRESDLLGLALFGGTPAAFAARHAFRHKTRKQPFSNQLWMIVLLQACAAIGWLFLR